MIQSANGSPLGEFVASDVELENEESQPEPGADRESVDDGEDWDLMDRNEASRAEDNESRTGGGGTKAKGSTRAGLKSGFGKKKAAPTVGLSATGNARTSRSRSSSLSDQRQGGPRTAPVADRFEVAMPDGAPDLRMMREIVVAEMEANLLSKDMSSAERAQLQKLLATFKAEAGL